MTHIATVHYVSKTVVILSSSKWDMSRAGKRSIKLKGHANNASFKTLMLEHNGCHFADDINSCILFDVMSFIWLKIRCYLFPSVQFTTSEQWCMKCLGAEQATSQYLNQCWPIWLASPSPNEFKSCTPDQYGSDITNDGMKNNLSNENVLASENWHWFLLWGFCWSYDKVV